MLNENPDALAKEWAATAATLKLAIPSPEVSVSDRAAPAAMRVKVNRSPDLAI